MSSKKVGVPNGSEPKVPNSSELEGSRLPAAPKDTTWKVSGSAPSGRPAVLEDGQLDDLAADMNKSLGRPPKLEELIAATGGCQRQRAVRALQRLREMLAAKAVQSALILPQHLEAEMRGWIDRLMSAAANQLAGEHAKLVYEHDQNEAASRDLIQEQQTVIADLRERLANQSRIGSELLSESQRLKAIAAQLSSERDIAIALAEDRLRLLEKISR